MNENIDQLKQEISEYYIKDFKEELGWLKSIALLPIEKKIKNLIAGKTELPQKFDEVKEFGRWKDIINFITPDTAKQIFEFMKQKRLEIQKRQTKEELENLKNSILGIQTGDPKNENSTRENKGNSSTSSEPISPKNQEGQKSGSEKENTTPNSTIIGASVGGIGAAGVYTLNKLNQNHEVKKMAQNIDAKKMKNTIKKAIGALEKQKEVLAAEKGANRLSTKQVKTIDKHIKKLSDGLSNIDEEGIDIIKNWKSLDGKLPKALLESTALDPKTLTKIENLGEEIIGKNTDEIIAILKQHNINNLDKSIIESLSKAEDLKEIKGMTKVLRYGSKTNRILQTLAGAMVIDVACLGLDVWMYLETKKEAELIAKVNEIRAENKRNQATTQLTIGVASVLVEAAIIGYAVTAGTAVGGPFGTVVGLAVGGISTAASLAVDSLYFDVHNFYTQNQEDFLRQSRGKLKHAILQGIHNKKEGNISLNEKVHATTAEWFSVEGKDNKEQSLKDACFSMLFLEEVELGDFKNDSDLLTYLHSGKSKKDFLQSLPEKEKAGFEKKRSAISEKINQRLEYIESRFKNSDVINAIKTNQGVKYLTEIFTASKLYTHQGKEKWKSDQSREQNLEIAKSEFFSDFPPEKVKKFENIKKTNPELFNEILITGSLDSLLEEDESDKNYEQNVKLIDRYQKWNSITQSYEEHTKLEIPDNNQNAKFIENLLKADFDLNKVEYPRIKKEHIIGIIQDHQERTGLTEISDDPMQNMLYQLAKELYGYNGNNDLEDLMHFFSADGESHGFYYDNKWKINEERTIDQGVDNFNLAEYSVKDIPQIINKILNKILRKPIQTSQPINSNINEAQKINYKDKSIIDTPTESIDENLQKERENKIKEILTKELSYRSKENKEKIKNQISAFVQQHAKNGEYIELPYYLLITARKAGFGDLQRQFFSRENGKLQILGMQSELNSGGQLNAERSYLTNAREKFSEQELWYINRVESAHQRLEKLRNKTGKSIFLTEGKEDDLDLPKEVEILISNKYKEREKFKTDLLMRNTKTAINIKTISQYEEFINYFENLYQGILLQLLDFKTSNDMDDFGYYQSAFAKGSTPLFDSKGTLKESDSPLLKNKAFKARYNRNLSIFKVGEKSIQDLWNSEDKKEKNLAFQASQLMIRNFLEFGLLKQDKDGNIETINYGNLQGHTAFLEQEKVKTDLINKFNEKLEKELGSLSVEPELVSAQNDIEALMKPITIKRLKQHETATIDYAKILQEQIEKTQDEIVWQGKRGNLNYLPQESALQSRNNKVEFKKEKNGFKLKGLDLNLDVKELCRLANFRNRCLYKYKEEQISFESEIISKTIAWLPTFVINGTVLLDRTTLNSYCPICKNDTAMEKITTWLNNQL